MMPSTQMNMDPNGMTPTNQVIANQQLEVSLIQSRQYSDRMRAALSVREQELLESRRREEDAIRAANEAVQAQRNLDLTLKEMQRMFAAKVSCELMQRLVKCMIDLWIKRVKLIWIPRLPYDFVGVPNSKT